MSLNQVNQNHASQKDMDQCQNNRQTVQQNKTFSERHISRMVYRWHQQLSSSNGCEHDKSHLFSSLGFKV